MEDGPIKFEEAARQGAAAAIILHEEEPAAYPWGVVEKQLARSTTRFAKRRHGCF